MAWTTDPALPVSSKMWPRALSPSCICNWCQSCSKSWQQQKRASWQLQSDTGQHLPFTNFTSFGRLDSCSTSIGLSWKVKMSDSVLRFKILKKRQAKIMLFSNICFWIQDFKIGCCNSKSSIKKWPEVLRRYAPTQVYSLALKVILWPKLGIWTPSSP